MMTDVTTDAVGVSPRIETLRCDLEAGRPAALEEFWRRIEREGAPLIEPIASGPRDLLVTFLWRDRGGDTDSVRVVGGPAGWFGSPNDAMERLLHTDLWYKTFRLHSDFRGFYRLLINKGVENPDSATRQELVECWRACRPDPLNSAVHVWPVNETDPESREEHSSLLELPDALPQPWFAPRGSIPTGMVEELTVTSSGLGNERRIWVYIPVKSGIHTKPPDLMILLDGWVWAVGMPVAPTLDNLIAESEIPPLAVVMVDYVDQTTRTRELACHEPFLAFLAEELLPVIRKRWQVTDDPRRTIIAGQSLGGLTAAFAGLELPHLFGNVLSQAGAFWWKNETFLRDDGQVDRDGEWLTRKFAETPKLPLRFYMDIGLLEGRKMLASNHDLRDVLRAKGYELTYQEFNGAHEWVCWRGTIADGLIALTTSRS